MRTSLTYIAGVLFLVLCVSLRGYADQKSDLDKRAKAAAEAGDGDTAAQLFCQEAALDPSDQQLQVNCKIYKAQAQMVNKRNEESFAEGVRAFNSGDFDNAEQKFKNIRSGPHLPEARNYLAKIPAARAAGDGDRQMEQKFSQGVQAYQSNDFASAKGIFGQVTGKHAQEAQAYLGKIRQFEQNMSQGDTLAAKNDYKGAASSYSEAASVKPDGPGDPHSKATRMQQLLASASTVPTAAPVIATNSTNVSISSHPTASNTNPVTAIKTPSRPGVDIAKLRREAQAARRKGDVSSAIGKYLAILAADKDDAEAAAALNELKNDSSAGTAHASSEADVMLAKAIQEFYTGYYEDAEVHIKDYLGYHGSKVALSNFYLGVCKVTRFYLGGEKESDQKLLNDARAAFHSAKEQGFTPPDQRYISPKILKLFQQS